MLDPLFYPYMGGTEKVVFEIGKRLVKKHGHEVQVLTSQIPGTPKRDQLEGMEIIRTPSIYFEKLPYPMPPPYTLAPTIPFDILKMDADIFHLHSRYWYFTGAMAALKSKPAKLMLTIHNAKPKGVSPATDVLGHMYDIVWGQQVMRFCDRITAVSQYSKDVTIPKDAMHKCDVVYNGVNHENFTPGKTKGSKKIRGDRGLDGKTVYFANSRLVEQKGLKYLIDAFAKVNKKYDSALVIIGHGPLRKDLEKQTTRHGMKLGKDVFFEGAGIFDKQLSDFFKAADVYVHPALFEPFGLTIVEAAATGLPIIATNTGGIPEIVDKKLGYLVETGQSDPFAEKMAILAEDKKLRNKLGKNARKMVEKRFTWDKIAKDMDKVYKKVV